MKIGFKSSDGVTGDLIQWITNSKWTHCFIVLDDTLEGDPIVFESAAYGGVRLNLLSQYKNATIELYEIPGNLTIKPLYEYIGATYGYLEILGFVVAKCFRFKHNPISKDYICSEIALRFLLENNVKGFDQLDPNKTAPGDLYKIVSVNFKLISIL